MPGLNDFLWALRRVAVLTKQYDGDYDRAMQHLRDEAMDIGLRDLFHWMNEIGYLVCWKHQFYDEAIATLRRWDKQSQDWNASLKKAMSCASAGAPALVLRDELLHWQDVRVGQIR